jgi:hypothetical protein
MWLGAICLITIKVIVIIIIIIIIIIITIIIIIITTITKILGSDRWQNHLLLIAPINLLSLDLVPHTRVGRHH